MPKVSITGNIHHEPSNLNPGDTGDFTLNLTQTLDQVLKLGPLSLNASTGSPLDLSVVVPTKLVAVRVVSGGPIVTLILSGPGGSNQTIQVTEQAHIGCSGAPFTAVKLAGVAVVEVLLGA